ncbi:MAG: carboxymuconolactone decarboxylase family protein [Fulvivirga sp.]
MNTRIQIDQMVPQVFNAMYNLETHMQDSKLNKSHIELIKIRASQINSCAFCIDMHTKDALKNGESVQRIMLLDAWKEAGLYSEEEEIILQMTEEVTLIHQQGLSDATYQKALDHFDEEYVALLIMMIVTINAWNRMSIATQIPVPHTATAAVDHA